MNQVAAIRSSILLHLIEHIEQTSLSADTLLASYGLSRGQVADPHFRVPLSRYIPLFEGAAQKLGTPELGAVLGTRITPRDLGPAGVLFSVSPTILDGLNRLTRHILAIQSSTTNGVRRVGEAYVWTYQLSASKLWPRRQDSEFTLSSSCQLIRSSFSRNWRPMEVHFEHEEPADVTRLEAIFRAPLKFGQSSNRMIIAGADAERVYRSDDTDIVTVLEQYVLA
ncbi:MAG: AraC family transcriptional regulator, partial [Rhizobium pusense]|nr:AraC family transcriptional regulator [Agrobacterium pusense]